MTTNVILAAAASLSFSFPMNGSKLDKSLRTATITEGSLMTADKYNSQMRRTVFLFLRDLNEMPVLLFPSVSSSKAAPCLLDENTFSMVLVIVELKSL